MSWVYTEKDVIRYALSVGCTREETKYLYENDEHFAVLPTFGVLALHNGDALNSVDFGEHVPDFNPVSPSKSFIILGFAFASLPDMFKQQAR